MRWVSVAKFTSWMNNAGTASSAIAARIPANRQKTAIAHNRRGNRVRAVSQFTTGVQA
jgi:hypothetical protein